MVIDDSIVRGAQRFPYTVRCQIYASIVEYLEFRRMPDLDSMNQMAAGVFEMLQPFLERRVERTDRLCKKSVYLMARGGEFKIGVSSDVDRRSRELGVETVIAYSDPVSRPFSVESMLHERFSDKRIIGEWFSLSEDDIADLTEYIESITDGEEIRVM